MKKIIIEFENDDVLEKALEKIKTHISNGITKKEFQVNKTKVSFKLEEIVPQTRIRIGIDDLNKVLSNTIGKEIDIRNLNSLSLYLEATYQVRYNAIELYINLKELNGEKIEESDPRYSLNTENEDFFYDMWDNFIEYYGYAIKAFNSPESMIQQFFDDELNKLIKLKGFVIETEGYEGRDS